MAEQQYVCHVKCYHRNQLWSPRDLYTPTPGEVVPRFFRPVTEDDPIPAPELVSPGPATLKEMTPPNISNLTDINTMSEYNESQKPKPPGVPNGGEPPKKNRGGWPKGRPRKPKEAIPCP